VRLSCLARNGRSPGEESLAAAIAVQAIEAQPAFGQIKPMRGQVLACAEQHFGDVPANDRLKQEAPHSRRRKRKPGVQKGGPLSPNRQKPAYPPAIPGAVCRRDHPAQSKSSDEAAIISRSSWTIRASTLRSMPTERETINACSYPPVVVTPLGGCIGLSAAPGPRAWSVCIDRRAQAVPPTMVALTTANASRHHSWGMPNCVRARVT
jgi:hypothetical protein